MRVAFPALAVAVLAACSGSTFGELALEARWLEVGAAAEVIDGAVAEARGRAHRPGRRDRVAPQPVTAPHIQ